jgi:glycerol-3-phosphate dehydrogenase
VSTAHEPYDLVILGGGINGAGIARDAALRGLRTLLLEKGDFASGTSSKSSKLIHGGLRYLEHGEFGLVFESVSERALQRKLAPHLVRPLPFLIPVYKDAKPGLEVMNIGLWIYDTLALFRSPKIHRTFRGAKASDLEPALVKTGLRGAIEYYDCVTDDARLVLENIIDARDLGADCRSYALVTGFARDSRGRVREVRFRDVLTGEEGAAETRAVIVAAGAWTDEVADTIELGVGRRLLRRTKGVHIVFPQDKLPLRRAVTLLGSDGRVMFAIPWKGRTVLGTTDTDFEGTADDVHADGDDVRYLCEGGNRYFPNARFRPEEVIGTWAGLRPLIAQGSAAKASDVSREHEIFVRDDGVTIIAGGKLTTYRRMAKECVNKTLERLRASHPDAFAGRSLRSAGTGKRPLPGAAGLERRSMTGVHSFARSLVADHDLDYVAAHHLAYTYGSRSAMVGALIDRDRSLAAPLQSDLPHVWAEIEFAVAHDLARTLDDVLSRRVPLVLIGRDQGLDVVDAVADRLAKQLGWSTQHAREEVKRYRKTVADSRRFHADLGW